MIYNKEYNYHLQYNCKYIYISNLIASKSSVGILVAGLVLFL